MGNHIFVQFYHCVVFQVAEGDAYGCICSDNLEVGAADDKVTPGSGGAVFQSGFAVFHFEDIHYVILFAEDMDGGLGDFLAEHLVLGKGDVNVVFCRVPFAAFHHAGKTGGCLKQVGVDCVAVHQQLCTGAAEKGGGMGKRFRRQPGVFGKHFFLDFLHVRFACAFEYKDFVVGICCYRIVGKPAF